MVRQAKRNFVDLLPNLTCCNLMENKEDAQLRMDWNAIGGLRGRCKVEEKPNYNNKSKTHSEITEFLPPASNGKKWGSGF